MTVPVWMLVGFAAWTMLLLLATVGVYRWSRILTGRVPIRSFRADQVEGADWYKRAMRAHANCVENLPVFGAIVFGLYVGNVTSTFVDALAVAGARMFRSDQLRDIRTLRVFFRADRQLSVVDWDPADPTEWKRITTGSSGP